MREFGQEHLDPEERDAVRTRHARWYLAEAERTAGELADPDEAEAVAQLDRDFA